MEMNKKTIKTVIDALHIAKKFTEISILLDKKAKTDIFSLTVDDQLRTVEQIKEYDVLISQFKELSVRQDYAIGEE